MNWQNRVYCGEISHQRAGTSVLLMGWVDAIRDHGNVLFIHMRDISGIVQVVFNPELGEGLREAAARLREEYVVEVHGEVMSRAPGTENPHLSTGRLEVSARRLTILSTSRALPFPISEKAMVFGQEIESGPEKVDEEIRLRYRYLDMRRPSVQDHFIKRYEIMRCIRDTLHALRFVEVETPFLTRSTPEGARDYLVPSRVHKGKFYALPQSPQLFKQLLMIGGMDRYFQIARCFRDEDLRPNRQPEFTQLDLEASFVDESFLYTIVEELTARMFALGGVSLERPFPRMTYAEAMARYGTDRPDTRFGMAFEDITDVLGRTSYGIFRNMISSGGNISGFCVKGKGEALSKNVLQNEYALKIVPSLGAKGMTWMKIVNGKPQSNIVQFFTPGELERMVERFDAKEGDVIMMIADAAKDVVLKALGGLRLHVAERFDMIPGERFCPLWVTDFPLFEAKDGALSSQHHPFTMPDRTDFDPLNREELLSLNSRAYDLVMNGEELGGGSVRIHAMDIQERIFTALGLTKRQADEKFGFFLRALEYGAPPHAGLALGLDRVIAMILGAASIRDVIAFPKNRSAFCPLTWAPAPADGTQLDELGIRFAKDLEEPDGSLSAGGEHTPHTERGEMISREEVAHVAQLARLRLDPEDVPRFQRDLNAILEFVETLKELGTQDVHPMSHVLEVKNIWREDTPRKETSVEPLLSNAPMRDGRYFKVPRILEG